MLEKIVNVIHTISEFASELSLLKEYVILTREDFTLRKIDQINLYRVRLPMSKG